MKKVSLFLVILLMVTMPTLALANETQENPNTISEQELKEFLVNEAGLSEDEVKRIPEDIQKELFEENAKLLATNGIQHYPMIEFNEEGTSDVTGLSLYGSAWEVTSDWSGYKKIYFYGDFSWDGRTLNNFTDGFSIGWPGYNQFVLPSSGGSITQHSSQVCGYNEPGQNYMCKSYKTTPDDYDLGQGVGTHMDLSHLFYDTSGYVSQYAYIEDQHSDTTNILFRYGHKSLGGSVSFGTSSQGFTVQPGWTTTTQDYVITLQY